MASTFLMVFECKNERYSTIQVGKHPTWVMMNQHTPVECEISLPVVHVFAGPMLQGAKNGLLPRRFAIHSSLPLKRDNEQDKKLFTSFNTG